MGDFVVRRTAEARAVLESVELRPHGGPASLVGPLAELRMEMARFSDSAHHPERRRAVEQSISLVEDFPFRQDAKSRTLERLDGRRLDAIADLGFVVPTEALASALGVAASDLDSVRRCVSEVVGVIGRRQPPTPTSEEALARLRLSFADHSCGSTAAISLLYQNHDATAALLGSTLDADFLGVDRRPALSSTFRTSVDATRVAGIDVPAETTVRVDLEAADLEFGAGPHACPGQQIAEGIVSGITTAIADRSYRPVGHLVAYDAEARPTALPMECQSLRPRRDPG